MSETSESPTSPPPVAVDQQHNNPDPLIKSESPTSPLPKVDLQFHNNSQTSQSPTSPPSDQVQLHKSKSPGLLSDIVLWRRKQLNGAILLAATAIWIIMDVYKYNFVTLLSWIAIAVLASLFFWGSMHRFLKKEAPDLSEFEISNETATEQAKLLRQRAEDGLRLMFHVGVEREWFVFAGVVISLYLTSLLPKHLDFLTLCFIGIVGAMSVPAVYVKNEQRIREFADNVRRKSRSLNMMIEEELQKMRNKIGGKQKVIKEKKIE